MQNKFTYAIGIAMLLCVLFASTAATPPPPPDKYAKVVRVLAIGKEVLEWVNLAFRTYETAQEAVFGEKAGLELTSKVSEKVDWYVDGVWAGTTRGTSERLTLRLNKGGYKIDAQCGPNHDIRYVTLRPGALQNVEATFQQIAVDIAKPSDIPYKAMEYLNKYFPDFQPSEARVQTQRYGYEVLFRYKGDEMEVEFDHNNNWLETEWENVSAARIPQLVRDKVAQRFPGAPIQEYEIEKTASGTFYEIEAMVNGIEFEVYYSADGKRQWNQNEDYDAPRQ